MISKDGDQTDRLTGDFNAVEALYRRERNFIFQPQRVILDEMFWNLKSAAEKPDFSKSGGAKTLNVDCMNRLKQRAEEFRGKVLDASVIPLESS